VNELYDRIMTAVAALPMKWLSVPGEKLNIILMCATPLMVPILRSAEHIRNFVRSTV
jgi:hypothetical protein